MDIRIAPQLKQINDPKLSLMEVDLTKEFEFPTGVTDVVHAAGRVSDWGSYQSFYKINVEATEG